LIYHSIHLKIITFIQLLMVLSAGRISPPKLTQNQRKMCFSLSFLSFFRTFATMKQVRPKKNLGQHFLTDLSIAKRIADTVDACPELPVLEVGPGMGVMTQFLAEKPRPLKVVEIDRESVDYLNERFVRLRDNIIGEDFLRMDLRTLFDGGQFVLTGNYPYDISSQIFFKMLDNRDLIPCCTGMIQHEVAVRMAAQPGNKQYGILSVLIQAWYHVDYLFTVEPDVFNPPPKVKSAVIRMMRNEVQQLGCDEQLFKRVVKATFNQRRKMLRVSLRQIFDAQHPASADFFQRDMMTRRPEQLSIPEFVELTNMVAEQLVQP
jgi:16S rRNA (adenine1518-N6/adenine1519-N6)-dimethyltransferase